MKSGVSTIFPNQLSRSFAGVSSRIYDVFTASKANRSAGFPYIEARRDVRIDPTNERVRGF